MACVIFSDNTHIHVWHIDVINFNLMEIKPLKGIIRSRKLEEEHTIQCSKKGTERQTLQNTSLLH